MERSFSSVQHQPFHPFLFRKEFQLDKLHQNDGEKDAGAKRRRKKCDKIEIYSDEAVFSCSGKFFLREKSDYVLRSGETQSCGEAGKQDEKKFETWRSAEFSSEAERCIPWRVDGWQRSETCRNRRESGIMGIFWIWIPERSRGWSNWWALLHTKRARRNLRLPVFQINQGILKLKEGNGHIFLHILGNRVLLGQSLFDCEKDLRSRTYGWNGGPQRERGYLENVYEYHTESIISGVLWRSYSKKLKNWSRTRQRSLVYQWLITEITHGARQGCCVTEFIRSRKPRPTSTPTRCSVWEVLKRTRTRLGRRNVVFRE